MVAIVELGLDFITRIAGPPRRTGQVTVAKVPSEWRRDIYKRRDVTPQRMIEAGLRSNPAFLRDAAFGFLVSQYPTTFRGLCVAMLWRARHMIADLGGRSLKRHARRWLLRRNALGAAVRRSRCGPGSPLSHGAKTRSTQAWW